MKINHKLAVHAYKYDGCLYRTFEFPRVIYENDQYLILDLSNCRIISQAKNKKFYHSYSKKDSLWVIFKNEWYNLFVTINDSKKIIYYFNVASPYIFEEDAIKYIDLDLDVRVVDATTRIESIKVLDEKEFEQHGQIMKYPSKLIKKALDVKEEIIAKLETKYFQTVFNKELFQTLDHIINNPTRKRHYYAKRNK